MEQMYFDHHVLKIHRLLFIRQLVCHVPVSLFSSSSDSIRFALKQNFPEISQVILQIEPIKCRQLLQGQQN